MGVAEKTATPIFSFVMPTKLDLLYFSVHVPPFSFDN